MSDKTPLELLKHLPIMDENRNQFTVAMMEVAMEQGANALTDLARALSDCRAELEQVTKAYREHLEAASDRLASHAEREGPGHDLPCWPVEQLARDRAKNALRSSRLRGIVGMWNTRDCAD